MLNATRRTAAQTLGQSTYAEIRRQILHGELSPGEFVSERVLADRLQAGKAAVRVAVQRLAAEGFISVQPRRGMVVASQSIQDVIDLFQVRLLIEQRVVRSIAGTLNSAQMASLWEFMPLMQAAMATGDAVRVVECDFAFHQHMCELHGNKHLAGVLERILVGLYRETWLTTSMLPSHGEDVLLKHAGIIEAIEKGEGARAELLLRDHVTLGEQCVLSRRPAR
jgi:DNA-binding GntR family transcriptional regulator